MSLYRLWGGWVAYGVARGLRSEYESELLSTRMIISVGNGALYGICPYIPMKSLLDRIQIRVQGLNPSIYPEAYKDFLCVNKNTFL